MTNESSPHWLAGRIGRPVGLRGECVVHPESNDPEDLERIRAAPIRLVREGEDPSAEPARTWESLRWQSGRAVSRFSGLDSREAISACVHWQLWVDRRDLADPEGPDRWWAADLIGCRAFQVGGPDVELGTVVAISAGPHHDFLVIERSSEHQVQVPFLKTFLVEVDLKSGSIRLDLPEGLIED